MEIVTHVETRFDKTGKVVLAVTYAELYTGGHPDIVIGQPHTMLYSIIPPHNLDIDEPPTENVRFIGNDGVWGQEQK